MFEKFKHVAALMMVALGVSKLPIEDGKLKFTEEQEAKLKAALGEDISLTEVVQRMNQELADARAAEDAKNDNVLADLREEARKILIAQGLAQEDAAAAAENPQAQTDEIKGLLNGLIRANKAMDAKIQKLIKTPEEDIPEAVNAVKNVIQHSKTHLFASNKPYDAFEGRPWNQRAAGITPHATDFSDRAQVEKLQGDLDLYFRENPDQVRSLIRDNFGLPAFWPKRLNVDDRVSDATIVTAEVTQARKLPWLPKNKQRIEAEEGKIYPVQIDAEWIGFNLQKMESSWLNFLNNEGSQPGKMSFIRFCLGELDKRARIEDRVSSIKGIYVETPEDAVTPGRAISRQNGILYQLWRAVHITKKIRDFEVGLPTTTNIVDYVDTMIKKLPDDVRGMSGLHFYLSPDWLQAYKRRYEQIHGTYMDYKGYPANPKDYDNINFTPLVDLTGSDVMFITFDNNIEILENIPAEKSKYSFETLKRKFYVYADYKLGIRFVHLGATVKPGDPDEFKVQTVWVNNAPMYKPDYFVIAYDDETGKPFLPYSNIEVDAGWKTNITEVTGTYEGQVIKIKGNTAATGLVKHGAGKIVLTGSADWDISTGGTLTLIAGASNVLTEIKRTTAPESEPDHIVEFNATSIDANDGNVFLRAGTGAIVLGSILHGVEGQIITVKGIATHTTTINSVVGNISVASQAVLAHVDDFVKFVKVDGVWTEIDRNIEQ